ncbi:LOW QUALITY PROTEIN: hypothetical protein PoB_002284100 [Plakobranchus ocellatus]|uniref:Uncharacterized protein n=1 Tax=Plakobranchus ocellatus TaxID=259542 RepID=A0AAV3ZAM7_9GAST|nr:LOW QUALITY PROTEIN: hypothetical protein PoB_002284100 [Plakobranchus ocellatus]
MKCTVQHDSSFMDPFPIKRGVTQGCVLDLTLFGILFSFLLCYAFGRSEDGVYLHTRSDGSLFNLSCLRAKTSYVKWLARAELYTPDKNAGSTPSTNAPNGSHFLPNKEILERAGTLSKFALITKKCLRWLGHVTRMHDGRLPKVILYSELATGSRPTERPTLRYKDVCKLKADGINKPQVTGSRPQ